MTADQLHVAITGATGLVGTALTQHLRGDGHRVTPVTRRPDTDGAIFWDPSNGRLDSDALAGVDAVVHLAGEPLGARRWTTEQKRRIRDSRIDGTSLLASTLAAMPAGPATLISASGIDYYPDGDTPRTEDDPPANDFLGTVCQQWEAATEPAGHAGIRVVNVRTAQVLSPSGGSLARMLPLFRLGLGGRFGHGRQWWSWVSMTDHLALLTYALTHDEITGPVNSSAPNPVTNAEFTATLAKVLGRPAVFRIPKAGPALLFGREMVSNLLYSGARVIPEAIQHHGYTFRHPELQGALRAELNLE